MAEGDDTTPIGNFVPLVAPGPTGDRPPAADDNTPIGSFKPLLSTSFEKVPSKDNGSGSVWGDIERNLGLGTRNVIEGVTALPGQIADVATYPGRWINRQIGLPTTAPSDLIKGGLDATGLPVPQTDEEKRNAEIIRGGAAMLTPMGMALGAPRLVASLPAAVRPLIAPTTEASTPLAATQVVAGGAGAAAGDALANDERVPEWLKPTARLIGNVVGAGATSGVAGAAGTLINMAKGVPSDIAAALARLGIKPTTAGAVTDRPGIQGLEAVATGAPVSGGMLQPKQRAMVDQFGNAVEDTATQLDPTKGRIVTAQDAGTAVQDALRTWRDTTWKAEQDNAWTPLNTRLAGTSVDPSSYRTALLRAAKDPALDSLPEIQKSFAQGKIQEWLDALNKDVPPGQNMSWEQAQAIKRRIGDQMGSPEIVASMGGNALKNIYGSLADDMKTTATQHGQGNLFDAANQVTINGHQFIDGTLSKAIQKNNAGQETIRPDDAAAALLRDNTAMQQLRDRVPDAADALAAYKLRAMAAAKPSAQGDTSTGSFETALRQQRRGDPEGTAALFNDPAVAGRVRDLETVADQFRSVEKNMNTSKTGLTQLLLSLGGQLGTAYGVSGLGAAGTVLAGNLGAPYVAGKFLTNPALIRYMSAQPGATTPMRGRVAGLLGAQATMPDDQRP